MNIALLICNVTFSNKSHGIAASVKLSSASTVLHCSPESSALFDREPTLYYASFFSIWLLQTIIELICNNFHKILQYSALLSIRMCMLRYFTVSRLIIHY
jgi:hypothetical protein